MALDQPATQIDDFATTDQNDDEQLSYTYTPRGELETRTLQKRSGGVWLGEQSSIRTYFANGLLKTLENKKGDGGQIEHHALTYTRDGIYLNGNRASDRFTLKGPDSNAPCYWDPPACTSTWSYDARERLTMEIPGADSLGNQDCSVKSAYAGTTCPGAGNANLLDDNLYDYKSRLQGNRYYNGAPSASKTTDYTNDPLDRPVKQVETIAGSGTTYDFTYVGVTNALSKEVLAGATNATKRYAYDAFGQRATIAETKAGETKRYSYLYDPHTSVSLLIDQANLVKESYGYHAYGAPNAALTRTASGFDAKTNHYRYTGKRLDSGSGTYDMGARRYSASTGRFLQYDLFADALDNLRLAADPLTQNRYALAGGNPVNFVEFDGHVAHMIADGSGRQRGCNYGACEHLRRDSDFDVIGAALDVVEGASNVAAGLNRAKKELSRKLRAGSSFAGKHLKTVAKLSKRVEKLVRVSGPLTAAAFAIDIAGGEKVARAAARTLGGLVGAAAGVAACSVLTSMSGGGAALTCVLLVPAGSYVGQRLATETFDFLFPKKKQEGEAEHVAISR